MIISKMAAVEITLVRPSVHSPPPIFCRVQRRQVNGWLSTCVVSLSTPRSGRSTRSSVEQSKCTCPLQAAEGSFVHSFL